MLMALKFLNRFKSLIKSAQSPARSTLAQPHRQGIPGMPSRLSRLYPAKAIPCSPAVPLAPVKPGEPGAVTGGGCRCNIRGASEIVEIPGW